MLRENVAACDAGANADVRVAKANSAASAEVLMVNNKIGQYDSRRRDSRYNTVSGESMNDVTKRSLGGGRAAGVSFF